MDLEGVYYLIDTRIVPLCGRYKRDDMRTYGLNSFRDEVSTHLETVKELFQEFQSEYGRCISKVMHGNEPKEVGWVFEKRMAYEDEPKEHYIQETWITLHRKCTHCSGGFTHAEIEKKPYNPGPE